MARGPKKHLKRIKTPKSWMIGKLGGVWCHRPSSGPHKLKESIPLGILLRNRLKYALNGREATVIVNDKEGTVKVDHRIRRDIKFPVGQNDVLTLEKTGENFRILYDSKGRFVLKKIQPEEAKYKVLKVISKRLGTNKIPYIVTNDGRTIRFPHPDIAVYDSIKYNILENKIEEYAKLEPGNVCYCLSGNNVGRTGIIQHRDRHLGGFDIVNMRDANGKNYATRIGNIMVLGKGKKPWISLPKGNGLYLTALEEKRQKEANHK